MRNDAHATDVPLNITEWPARRIRAFGGPYLRKLAISIARWGLTVGLVGAVVAWWGHRPPPAPNPTNAFLVFGLVAMGFRLLMALFPRIFCVKGKVVSLHGEARKNYWRIEDLVGVEIVPATQTYSILRFSAPVRRRVETFEFAFPLALTDTIRERLIEDPALPQPAIAMEPVVGTLNYGARPRSRRPWLFLAMWTMACFYIVLALVCFWAAILPRFAHSRIGYIALALFFLVCAFVVTANVRRWQKLSKSYTDFDEKPDR